MCLESLKGLGILEVLEGVEGLELIDNLERQSWAFGSFFIFAPLKNRNTKTVLEKIDLFLVTDRLDCY